MTTVAAPTTAEVARPLGREPGWWGMLLFVAAEAALFALLLAAYFYVRVHSADWPQGGIEKPDLWRPIVMTVLLAAGSVTVFLATRYARSGRSGALRAALAVTLALGLAFVAVESWEYADTLDRFSPHTNAYGSLFYTVNGMHGAHVAAGALLVLWTLVLACAGRITPTRNLVVQNVALYWHFATVSWLAVFVSLYLSVAL